MRSSPCVIALALLVMTTATSSAGCALAQKRHAPNGAAVDDVKAGAQRSRVTLLGDNARAWAERWRVIDEAQDSVDVASFIVEGDVFGLALLGHLYDKAQGGVRVRVLVDGRGSELLVRPLGTKDHLEELVQTGMASVRVYNPPVAMLSSWSASPFDVVVSTHNKILVADGERGITGGRNVSRAYFASELEERAGFIDADVLIEGSAAHGLVDAFERDFGCSAHEELRADAVNMVSRREELLIVAGAMDAWLRGQIDPRLAATDVVLRLEAAGIAKLGPGALPSREVRDAVRPWLEELAALRSIAGSLDREGGRALRKHDARVVVVGSASAFQDGVDDIGATLVAAIREARGHVILQSPYLILTPPVLRALEDAAARGVRIDVVTNSALSTDNPASASLLLDTWPEILARVPTMRLFVKPALPTLHAKRVVVDDELTLIGSYNLDPLSAYRNSEAVVAVWSRDVNAETRAELEPLIAESIEYRIVRPVQRVNGRVLVEFGPRDHLRAELVDDLVAQRGVVIALQEMLQMDVVVAAE